MGLSVTATSPVIRDVGFHYPLTDLLVTLNRPRVLNALSAGLFADVNDALRKFDDDKDTGAIVLTGSNKAFAGMVQCLNSNCDGNSQGKTSCF